MPFFQRDGKPILTVLCSAMGLGMPNSSASGSSSEEVSKLAWSDALLSAKTLRDFRAHLK